MKNAQASRSAEFHVGQLVRPNCPHCAEQQFASAACVHVNDNDIRHWWNCENCGHQFMTTVRLVRKPSSCYALS